MQLVSKSALNNGFEEREYIKGEIAVILVKARMLSA